MKRLSAWGINRIYGFPGDGINGIMGALNRAGDLMKFVQVRHEEMAAFMACAHAKFTGEVGVCLATSRARRDPSLERSLRCEDGSPIRGRHRRPTGARCAGRRVSTGSRSHFALQRCGARVRPHVLGPHADAAPGRSRGPNREDGALRDLHHHSERCAGTGCGREATAGPRHGAFRDRVSLAPRHSERRRFAARGRGFERRQKSRDPDRGRCARRGGRSDAGGGLARRGRGQGAARESGAAR